jgi:hypothetical protein
MSAPRRVPKGPEARSILAGIRFNQQSVERFRTDVALAIGHSKSRNIHVAQAACYFSLMGAAKKELKDAAVAIHGAAAKAFTSPTGFQAAHYLPGQVMIQNKAGSLDLPWNFIVDLSTRTRLECLFADEEELPTIYNRADSAAEQKGLRETFRRISQEAICQAAGSSSGGGTRELVRRLYNDIWIPEADKAYSDAISQKLTVSEVPPLETDELGNIMNLKEREIADWSRKNEADILVRYREALRPDPEGERYVMSRIAEIESTFRP